MRREKQSFIIVMVWWESTALFCFQKQVCAVHPPNRACTSQCTRLSIHTTSGFSFCSHSEFRTCIHHLQHRTDHIFSLSILPLLCFVNLCVFAQLLYQYHQNIILFLGNLDILPYIGSFSPFGNNYIFPLSGHYRHLLSQCRWTLYMHFYGLVSFFHVRTVLLFSVGIKKSSMFRIGINISTLLLSVRLRVPLLIFLTLLLRLTLISYPRNSALSELCVIFVFSLLNSNFSSVARSLISSASLRVPEIPMIKSSAYRTYTNFLSVASLLGSFRNSTFALCICLSSSFRATGSVSVE